MSMQYNTIRIYIAPSFCRAGSDTCIINNDKNNLEKGGITCLYLPCGSKRLTGCSLKLHVLYGDLTSKCPPSLGVRT